MKPKTVKILLHTWGLFWIIALSFYILDTKTASITILCSLPVNYWLSNMIYKFIYETKEKDQ
jgi:hypothetical protein